MVSCVHAITVCVPCCVSTQVSVRIVSSCDLCQLDKPGRSSELTLQCIKSLQISGALASHLLSGHERVLVLKGIRLRPQALLVLAGLPPPWHL